MSVTMRRGYLIVSIILVCRASMAVETKTIQMGLPLLSPDRVLVTHILTVGQEQLDDERYLFSLVGDIAVDANDNLLVLDIRSNKVSAFSADGKYIGSYGKGKGQGPGEFLQSAHLAADDKGIIYVSDKLKRVVYAFDARNELVNTIRTHNFTQPNADIGILGHGLLGLGADISIERNRENGIFQIYSLPHGSFLFSTGELGKVALLDHVDRYDAWFSESASQLCFDEPRKRLIISYGSSSIIEIRSLTGQLLKSIRWNGAERVLSFGRPKVDRFYILQDATVGLTVLPDGRIVNCVRHIEKDGDRPVISFSFHVLSQDGETCLVKIPGEKFGDIEDKYFHICSDSKGCLYLFLNAPFPRVLKFKIDIPVN